LPCMEAPGTMVREASNLNPAAPPLAETGTSSEGVGLSMALNAKKSKNLPFANRSIRDLSPISLFLMSKRTI
ncbi:MAG: hypothetical protein L7F78_10640, partial [Syntrophales bacterium LBB04]|nr:hypothetical protein [Syntrophales bacterium LBB04]